MHVTFRPNFLFPVFLKNRTTIQDLLSKVLSETKKILIKESSVWIQTFQSMLGSIYITTEETCPPTLIINHQSNRNPADILVAQCNTTTGCESSCAEVIQVMDVLIFLGNDAEGNPVWQMQQQTHAVGCTCTASTLRYCSFLYFIFNHAIHTLKHTFRNH